MTLSNILTPALAHSTPSYAFLGVHMRVLLSSQQTGGQFSMIEGVMPPGGFDEFIAKAGMPLDETATTPEALSNAAPPSPEQMTHLVRLAEAFGIKILVPPGD